MSCASCVVGAVRPPEPGRFFLFVVFCWLVWFCCGCCLLLNSREVWRCLSACINGLPPSVCGGGSLTVAGGAAIAGDTVPKAVAARAATMTVHTACHADWPSWCHICRPAGKPSEVAFFILTPVYENRTQLMMRNRAGFLCRCR